MNQLESALQGRVTEECLSLYYVGRSMRKAAKSKLLELFNIDQVDLNQWNHISLMDMGMIWRQATLTPEDREAIAGVTTWIRFALSSSHAMLMHASSSSSKTSMTFPSVSRIMSMIYWQ